jgi:hypothetical protein
MKKVSKSTSKPKPIILKAKGFGAYAGQTKKEEKKDEGK